MYSRESDIWVLLFFLIVQPRKFLLSAYPSIRPRDFLLLASLLSKTQFQNITNTVRSTFENIIESSNEIASSMIITRSTEFIV